MKGKIIYTATIEKEIEIPDEIVELSKKSYWDRSEEQDTMLDDFIESIWESVDCLDRCGMYYEKENQLFAIEEY